MTRRPLGNTGLEVSPLGFGAGPVGSETLSDTEAEALLHGVLDAGINLLDTAPSYGRSEERIGRVLASRRREAVVSTKCGYGVPGVEDWTGPCITLGIERALTGCTSCRWTPRGSSLRRWPCASPPSPPG
ncbi:aldo/keto reductase [Stigmatella hybrida]|uniref:aldo/keto reductase n=1 Tax=Stigmatella hybrida TaxID=394097 RepID=UPI001CDA7554|nr:aldo/keto reductase [Stigmatella hybrida]